MDRRDQTSVERQPKRAMPHLSPRQLVCLRLVAAGKSSADIAYTLGLSVRTVDQHVAMACKRLHVRRRVQAVARGISCGLISYGR